jgi:beta-1,4-mannosyl-glycoprotein beta-1,4-N-acetylglucosaminyltransferase
MKIYDCFPFFNELDLLEIRLNELYDVVDYFVIIEGECTHQNNSKPLYYEENKERFVKFSDKIIHMVLDKENFNESSSHNEDISYNAFMSALEAIDANDEDIVIIDCADEIPKAEVVMDLANNYKHPVYFEVDNFCYYLNTRFEEGGRYWWTGPLISVGHLKQFNGQVKRCLEWGRNPQNAIPSSQATNIPLPHGWHFTFMGNKKDLYMKAHSYIHTEWNHLTEDDFQAAIDNLEDPFRRTVGSSHKFAEMYSIDKLPLYIQNNLEKFEYLLKKIKVQS